MIVLDTSVISEPEGYIAAIAAANGMVVATRDVAPFAAAGLQVLNPWQAPQPQ